MLFLFRVQQKKLTFISFRTNLYVVQQRLANRLTNHYISVKAAVTTTTTTTTTVMILEAVAHLVDYRPQPFHA